MRRTWILGAAAVVVIGAVIWWWAAAVDSGTEDAAPSAPGDITATMHPTAGEDPDPDPGTTGEATTEPGPEPATEPAVEPPATGEEPPLVDPTAPPVGLDDPAEVGAVTARLARIEAIQGEADGPGEVAGPALRVSVDLTNSGAEAVDLTGVVVNLFHGPEALPAEMLSGSGAAWLSGSLAPGATVTGVYVFPVPLDDRDPVQVTVFLTVDEPTVLFEGTLG